MKVGRNQPCPCGSVLKYKKCCLGRSGEAIENSPHYFRLKGEAAEKVAHDLACNSFFTDWCYPNPTLDDGKELCDLLVVFDDVAVIWQIKNLKLHEDGRYNRASVEKNTRQAVGAARRLMDVSRPLGLTNVRRGGEIFDPSTIKETYLISVLAGDGEYFFPAMDAIKNESVHIFTGEFMEIALRELDTARDFVDYLRAKEELLGRSQVIITGGEEELLATYLTHGRSFERFSEATGVLIEQGAWDTFVRSPEYGEKKKADAISYGWDSVIDRAHEADTPEYEIVARELARLNRFERRCLGKVMYDAAVTAHEDDEHPVFRRVLDFRGRTYCFVFMDDPEREARRAMLGAVCYVARGLFPENSVVLGIATEKKLRPSCSYDYCYLELPEWTNSDREKADAIQRDTGLLTSATMSRGHESEYPT